jgi:putative ABC transport system substrate-binding protein
VREIIPKAQCVALIYHSANAALELQVQATQAAARDLGLDLIVLKFSTAEEIDRTFEVARTKGAEVLLPASDPMALDNAKKIGALSIQHRVPVISPFQEITEAGGVVGYGPDLSTLFRRSAAVIDQILKGAKPGDIPIGEPQKFDLSVNLISARLLNLKIPSSLSSRAMFLVR